MMEDPLEFYSTLNAESGTVELLCHHEDPYKLDEPFGLSHLEEPLSISQLEQQWEQNKTALEGMTELNIALTSVLTDRTDETWLRLCQLVQQRLCRVKTVKVSMDFCGPDNKIASLLQHVSPGLRRLELTGFQGGDLTLTFQQIANWKQLSSLCLDKWHKNQFEDMGILAKSIQSLTMLQDMQISNWEMVNPPKDCLDPVLSVLQSKSKMKRIDIYNTDYSGAWFRPYPLDEALLKALQFWPRINQATCHYNLPDGSDQWMEALLSVQDRPDCLHYLLTQTPPHTYCYNNNNNTTSDIPQQSSSMMHNRSFQIGVMTLASMLPVLVAHQYNLLV